MYFKHSSCGRIFYGQVLENCSYVILGCNQLLNPISFALIVIVRLVSDRRTLVFFLSYLHVMCEFYYAELKFEFRKVRSVCCLTILCLATNPTHHLLVFR